MALDTLHTFYEGLVPTLKTQQLDAFSHQHRFPSLSIYFLVNYPYFASLYLISFVTFCRDGRWLIEEDDEGVGCYTQAVRGDVGIGPQGGLLQSGP